MSAEGKVQDKQWTASFPILLNIDGEATYFMSLKDKANVVKSYAMVNVEQYNVMAIPKSENVNLRNCLEEYIQGMAELNPPKIINFNFDAENVGVPDAESDADAAETDAAQNNVATVSGTITDIRTAVVSGTTYYYIELDNSGDYYYLAATIMNPVVLLNEGDSVTVTGAKQSADKLFTAERIALGTGAGEAAPAEETTAAEAIEETTAAAPAEAEETSAAAE